MISLRHRLALVMVSLCAASSALFAQDKVLLLKAESAQLLEINGESYRKVTGPARFLHNDTYLLCDTALWNINTNIIDAMGHVRIIQDQTTLSSSTLQYVVDQDLARFRGDLVQLEDKDKNTLRTRYLDYNTKDSVAVFQDGGAMRDKDGQVIESLYGTYDSKAHLFVFNDQVNMYMDTTFIKTSRLEYRSDLSTAWFGYNTDMWQDDKMLSADDGWYDRGKELFMFRRRVHTLTKEKETWSDSAYYYRALNNVELLGNVEIMDTVQNVFALAGYLQYIDSLDRAKLTRDPAIMSVVEEEGQLPDSLYLGADTLLYLGIRRCDIEESWIKDSEKRMSDISGDPIMEYRRKAAEAAAKAAEEAMKDDPNRPQGKGKGPRNAAGAKGPQGGPGAKAPDAKAPGANAPAKPGTKPQGPPPSDTVPPGRPTLPHLDSMMPKKDSLMPPVDSLTAPVDSVKAHIDSLRAQTDSLMIPPTDSLAVPADSLVAPADTLVAPTDTLVAPTDTLAAPADSLGAQLDSAALAPKDTTKVGFVWGQRNVKLFRRNMQMCADSMSYSDLDSLVRLYKQPIVYSDGNRQYAADSIYLVIKQKRAEKAHLLSNAFITIREDEISYDQISGTEMVAYFDSTSALTRFDALGGASTIFFLEEEGALATVNKVESKMLYATFTDGEIDHIYYYDNPKNDGYPSVQLPKEDRTLKGFRWEPEKRPDSPRAVTTLKPRKSQRTSYLAKPHTTFTQTELYFPGYIKKVYRDIAIRDSLEVIRSLQKGAVIDTLISEADSLAAPADSTLLSQQDSLALKDSLSAKTDSLSVQADSLTTKAEELTPEQLKAKKKAERAAEKARRKAEKQKAMEAKWAEQDRKYEEKQAAKAARKLERERAKKRKMLQRLERKSQREQRIFQRYLKRERERAARKAEKTNRKK